MSSEDRFFSRGGFLSSRLDDTEISNDADVMNYLCQNNAVQNGLFTSQSKSKREHAESKCGFST
jgi:hypothetical protein